MSELIKHECGIALVRLLKPLEYYQLKYGSWKYGLQKLYLLMEKQHNRGQDGAGLACVKLNTQPGSNYIFRERSAEPNAIDRIFQSVQSNIKKTAKNYKGVSIDAHFAKEKLPFIGELYLGHLRYGTFGGNSIESVHPVIRGNNWRSRNLVLAGNFNLTNVDQLFNILVDLGQHPTGYSDTVTILENVGHFLDGEVQKRFLQFKSQGLSNVEITANIENHLDVASVLRESSKKWDGGYVIGGLTGSGDSFVFRDPWGIRPAYYYYDDEIAVVASERPVIQTVFNKDVSEVHELKPGNAFIVKKSGTVEIEQIRESHTRRACSFERIYFSRGSDADIYNERKMLGKLLIPAIIKSVDNDLQNTVFSYIPNTAETAFFGMIRGVEKHMIEQQVKALMSIKGCVNESDIAELVNARPRIEKVAIKDAKLRTFITRDKGRDDLVGHVYDITYGSLRKGTDNLVIIDDSIVRGTTLKQSILRILDRLGPKRIVVVSSSPQIRYPDCYGIDMAKLNDFIAFQAAIALLRETGRENVINEVYNAAKKELQKPREEILNVVKRIYEPFTDEQISDKISQLLKAPELKAEVRIVYQTVDNLHVACPNNTGDWYFTGDYPTPGGNRVVNTSFINFIEGKDQRAY